GLNNIKTSTINFRSARALPSSLARSLYNSIKSPSICLTNFGWQYHRKKRRKARGGCMGSRFNVYSLFTAHCLLRTTVYCLLLLPTGKATFGISFQSASRVFFVYSIARLPRAVIWKYFLGLPARSSVASPSNDLM